MIPVQSLLLAAAIVVVAAMLQVRSAGVQRADEWQVATAESQGLSTPSLDALKDRLAAANTKALLVIRNDRNVYEWYAPDHSATARHYTASMAKAIVSGVAA